jgi:predicted molibdopterin-dependent oxidoreductase YjgC
MREELSREAVVQRGEPIDLLVDGEVIKAYAGETIAGALTAAGRRVFRHTEGTGAPRGVFCGIGICFDCLVTVEGMGRVRSCMVPVQPGMRVSLHGPGVLARGSDSATD